MDRISPNVGVFLRPCYVEILNETLQITMVHVC